MFGNPSLITRIAIGKGVGLVFGLLGFIFMPYFFPEAGLMIRFGVLFWYTTVGAVIGVFGVFTYHPILKLPMPWWVRAPVIGGWMNFVLTLMAYDQLQDMMTYMFGTDGLITSPFWAVSEGIFVGLIIGYLCTRFGGEGKATVEADQP